MMANLFSSFDPSSFCSTSLNWMSTVIYMTILTSVFWLIPSRWDYIILMILNFINKELKIIIKTHSFKGSTIMFMSLFIFILFNNFLGLFPYIFTSSSHLTMNLSLSLPLWLTFMLFGWMKNTTSMLAHLVPQGAPTVLLPFLVMIETISNLIRPGTLAIRLTANMIAGHLILTLLGNSGASLKPSLLMVLIIIQILLMVLETAVSLIQAYVFAVLATLYSSEVQ
uniref:ATP synthase subunit a n=1 Tax=Xyloterini sp. TaxID=2995406 RepID=A0A9E8G9W9_9CUCU|nr:ATP synthase F0 subunit 6 [Xyloterini sp.]